MNSLKKAMDLINNILDIPQDLGGELYLKEFVKNISKNLDVKYVLVGSPSDETLSCIKTNVVWAKDDFIDNFEYELKNTPCEYVLNGDRVCIHEAKVCERFPKDELLKEMNIESYVGAPVISKSKAGVSSILVLLDDKEIEDKDFFSIIIEFLAMRTSAEIEKINNEKYLKDELERRSKELKVANDKIKDLELKRSKEKFKTLFELSPIGMAMVDYESGEFLEVNQSLLNFTKYSKNDFLNLSFWDITPKEYEQQELEQLKELDKTGKFGPNIKEYIKKDGTKFPIKISGFKIEENGRKVVWGLIEDITENMQYETIYKDQKKLLEYITFENDLQKILDKIVKLAQKRNPKIICSILLLDESKKHLFTGSALNLPKFYNDAINGVEIGEKVGSCGSAAFLKKRVIVENINTHENWQPYLELTQKANLHACWSEPIISTNNEVLGTFAIYNNTPKKPDLYELKLIETYANIASKAIEKHNYNKKTQALSQRQKVLLSLFDKGESTLFMWENDGKCSVSFVSDSVKKLLSYEKEDFLTNQIKYENCIHKDDLSKVEKETKEALGKKLDYFKHEPYRIITKNNKEKWVLDYSVTQKDKDGNILYFIGYITDITEQTKNQELIFQQSKVASLGEMLGNIAHQWRQPLSLISTTATGSKLKKEIGILEDDEFYENMDSINEKAQYLSKTIDDFRNFFFTDSYNKKININLKISIEKVISLVNDSLRSSNITLIKKQTSEELIANCNENLLIQALINIINNARDAFNIIEDKNMEKYIFIDLFKDQNNIYIKIKDNAGGIKEDILDKIFEPYFTTKHKSQGTGIGLYMTSQIILKHLDARIDVKNTNFSYLNNNYKGACFEIVINYKHK